MPTFTSLYTKIQLSFRKFTLFLLVAFPALIMNNKNCGVEGCELFSASEFGSMKQKRFRPAASVE